MVEAAVAVVVVVVGTEAKNWPRKTKVVCNLAGPPLPGFLFDRIAHQGVITFTLPELN